MSYSQYDGSSILRMDPGLYIGCSSHELSLLIGSWVVPLRSYPFEGYSTIPPTQPLYGSICLGVRAEVKPDFGLFRDLIDLFDAIDSTRTHSVPIEAVEQLLGGMLL